MPLLPRGHRKSDPNDQGVRFRLGLIVRKYPVQIALIVALAVVAFPVYLLIDAKNDLAQAQRDLAAATLAMQRSREEAVRTDCEDQNRRNINTSISLVMAAAADEAARKTDAGRMEVIRRRDVTLALIDALAPKKNCADEVRRLRPPEIQGVR